MKIGIFGDSWARTIASPKNKKFHDGYAWAEILSLKYHVTNYGIPGSSVYFSYEEFNKHHSKYDKIIFLATEPGRLTFDIGSELKNPLIGQEFKRHCNSYGTADRYFKLFENKKVPEDSARVNAAREYFLWLLNRTEQTEYKRLMLDEIRRIRPDALIMSPAHAWDPIKQELTTCLMDISNMENDFFKVNYNDLADIGHLDIRPCHLTRENNKMFANKISDWIDHQTIPVLSKEDYVQPADGKEIYYDAS
jgi:hypothetical protein